MLARGLAVDPEQRWPSMDMLLLALREASLPFRRSTAALAAGLVLVTAVSWGQHALWQRRVDHELAASAARLPALLQAQSERVDLLVQAGLRSEQVFRALAQASNIDAALGLAEDASREHQLAEAHETFRSADLPGLKSRDALVVANAWGRVVLDLAAPDSFGAALPTLPILTDAMEGTPSDALWSAATLTRLGMPLVTALRPDDLLLVSARPVARGMSTIGLVMTGRWMDTGLLDELGQAAGARLVLHAPDGGWAGARWSVAPPVGRVVQLSIAGTTLRVLGVRLGAEGTRTPAGVAYVVRSLTPGETGGAAAPGVRWGLLAASVAALGWLGLLTRRSGWSLRSSPRD